MESAEVTKVMAKLARFASTNPRLAGKAYTVAADRVRRAAQASSDPRAGAKLARLAARLDLCARAASVPRQDALGELVTAGGPPPEKLMVSDFDQIESDFNEASEIAAADPESSELAVWAAFESLRGLRREGQAIPVRTTPQSVGQKTLLGNTVTVQASQATAALGAEVDAVFTSGANPVATAVKQWPAEQTALYWEGEDWETQAVTIQIGRVERGGQGIFPSGAVGASNIYYRPFGKLTFGSRGYRQDTIQIDVCRGLKFSVAANFVQLALGMDPPPAGAGNVGGAMTLGASMGFHQARTGSPITRTIYIDGQKSGGANKTNVVVPVFAQRLLPPQNSDLNGTTQLDFKDNFGNILYSLSFTTGSVASPIPLANDVYSIDLTYTGTATPNYRLIFELAL